MIWRFLLILFALPLLAAISHDLYLFYGNQEKGFHLATIGFIWSQYEEQSLREFMRPFDEEQREMVGFVLGQYAVTIGGVILGFALFIFGLILVFSGGSYRKHSAPRTKKDNRVDRIMKRQRGRGR